LARPLAVAITGGIGAGKSEALKAFARRGAAVASADEIVHRLYEEPEIRRALAERWGSAVLDVAGEVDRSRVAERVFADSEELLWLEGLLHPRVIAEQTRWRKQLAAQVDPPHLAVVEVPLLYETGGEARFDAVVVITAPDALRAERARVPVEGRSGRLIPDDEKVGRADFAYVNDGSLEELDAFIVGVVEQLEQRP
jgi:dephospho-CoA kinase